MIVRLVAGLAGLALALDAAPGAGAGPTPPPAPAPSPAPPPTGSPQAVLVQGYVKTASKDRLVLSAPGTTETLSLSIDPETRVLASGEERVSVENLKQGQLVRAALVPSGSDLVAVVVEVMPGEADRTPPGAAKPPAARPGGAPAAPPASPAPRASTGPSGPPQPSPNPRSVR